MISATNKPVRFSPHRGKGRDAAIRHLALSECGSWAASCCDRELVVTRLQNGWSNTVDNSEEANEAAIDALAWIGSRLLVAQGTTVREINVTALFDSGPGFVSQEGKPAARKPISIRTGMRLPELAHASRLDQHRELLSRYYAPALQMRSKALKKPGWQMPEMPKAPALGASRLGGWPDLPAAVEWPMWRERPMAFVAQINLAEAHAANEEIKLPKFGLLSFFLGCSDDTFENAQHHRECYTVDLNVDNEVSNFGRVLYHAELSDLRRLAYVDQPSPQLFEPCDVRMTAGGSCLPDEHTAAHVLLQQAMNQSAREDYADLITKLIRASEASKVEQLLGYPAQTRGHATRLLLRTCRVWPRSIFSRPSPYKCRKRA